jgi:Amino acid permease
MVFVGFVHARVCWMDWRGWFTGRFMAETVVVAAEHGLKKELRLRDLVPMQILMMVGVSWAGIAAKQGSTHPMIWIAGILFFFLPQAAVVTYCARLWPLEGGVYQWAKFALGPLAGFLSAWNYALYVILTVSGLGILTVTSLSYALGPGAAWMAENQGLTFAVDGVLLAGVLAINVVGFHFGKWVSHFGAAMMMVLALTFFVLLFWHPAATAGHPHISPQKPFAFGWPVWSLLTLNLYVKVAFNAYSGLEQVAVFAGETKNAGRAIVLFGVDCRAGDCGDLRADDGVDADVCAGGADRPGGADSAGAGGGAGGQLGSVAGAGDDSGAHRVYGRVVHDCDGGDEPAASGGGMG